MSFGYKQRVLGGAESLIEPGGKYLGPQTGVVHELSRAIVGDEAFETGSAVVEEGLQAIRSSLDCSRQTLLAVKHEMAARSADETLHTIKNPKTGQTHLEYLAALQMKCTKAADQSVRCARTAVFNPIYDKLATAVLVAHGRDLTESRAMERRARTMGEGDREAAGLVWREETVPGTGKLEWS